MKAIETKQNETERLYSAREVAAKWGISYWSLRAMVEERKIRPIIGIGKGWKFTSNELSEVVFERL